MSHLSSIGFQIKTQKALQQLAQEAMSRGERIAGGAAHYYRWHLDVGSELWVHVDAAGAVVGIEPHFAGPARMALTLRQHIARSPSALDGAFQGEPQQAAVEEAHPLIFDVPDYARHASLELPAAATVQLAAFAHSLQAYADADAFAAAQRTQGLAFAAKTLIPVSFFRREERPSPELPPELAAFFGDLGAEPAAQPLPEAVALLSGVVLETEMRLNETSSSIFRYLRLGTVGGEIDLVADPAIVRGEVVAGGVVYGDCWLSGRLVEE